MGALYILNLYYKDEKIDIGRVYLSDQNFDSRVGSEIFSTSYYQATGFSVSKHMNDTCISAPADGDLDKAIFVIKYDDKSYTEMHKNYCLDAQITEENFSKSTEIASFISVHPEYRGKSINEVCMAAGGANLLLRIISLKHTMQENSSRMEAVLNKHSQIYPELFPLQNQ